MFLFLFIVCVNWNDSLHLSSSVEFGNCHFCPTLPTHINPPRGPTNSRAGPPAPPMSEWTANPWNASASIGQRLPLESHHWWTPKLLSKGLSVLDIIQTVHLPLVLDTCETKITKTKEQKCFRSHIYLYILELYIILIFLFWWTALPVNFFLMASLELA